MNQQDRRAALAAVLAGILDDWSGLPSGCTADDFVAVSAGETAAGVGQLSGNPVLCRDFGGYPGPLRVFFDDAGHAFLVWADWPPGGADGAAAIATLGPADAVLSDATSRRPGTVQHVWPGRGIAAYVADDGAVRGLALFAPAPVEAYRANLGGSEAPPYRPYRSAA